MGSNIETSIVTKLKNYNFERTYKLKLKLLGTQHTEKQTPRDIEIQRHRNMDTHTHRHTDAQTNIHTKIHTSNYAITISSQDTQTHGHTDLRTHRHTER